MWIGDQRRDAIRASTRRLAPDQFVLVGDRLRVAPDGPLRKRTKVALAVEILSVYVRVRWLMSRQDIRTVVSGLRLGAAGQLVAFEAGTPESCLLAVRLGGAVHRTLSVLPTDSRCLAQALVLSRLLSTRAISSTLIIGARTKPRFEAHAWVEHEGQPVLSPQGFDELTLVEI